MRKYPLEEKTSGDDLEEESGLEPLSQLPKGKGNPPQIKPVWCPRADGTRQTGSPAGHDNDPLSRLSQTLLFHRTSLVDGQDRWLRTVHPLLTLVFFSTLIHPLHVAFFSSLILCTKPFGDGAMDDGGRLRIERAASSSYSARRRLAQMVAE